MTNYLYRADGTKVKKLFGDIETNYLDGFQYKSTKPSEASSGGGLVVIDPNEVAVMKLRIIPTSEGYFDVLTNQYIYNYKDHLGNVRLSYSDSNKDGIIQPRQYFSQQCDEPWNPFFPPNCISIWKPGEIVEVNNYYPFGLMHNYTATTQNAYQYKYNAKELQETGMYDYGARMYMPDIGRWGVVDPMAEVMRRYSPYNYAFDNPVNFIDPDGNAPYNPKDFYGSNSAFNDDFDPNTTIYGNGSFGGYKYYEMGFMYDGAGGNGADTYKGQEAYNVLQNFLNGGESSLSPWMQNYLNGNDFTDCCPGENDLLKGVVNGALGTLEDSFGLVGLGIKMIGGKEDLIPRLSTKDKTAELTGILLFAAMEPTPGGEISAGGKALKLKLTKYEKLADAFGTRSYIKEFSKTSPIQTRILFNDLTQGGVKKIINTPKGKIINATMPDGTIIQLRNFSTKSGNANHSTIQFIGSQNKWKFNY